MTSRSVGFRSVVANFHDIEKAFIPDVSGEKAVRSPKPQSIGTLFLDNFLINVISSTFLCRQIANRGRIHPVIECG